MSFVFLCSLLHVIAHKFPDVFVHDSYTVRGCMFKKCYSHWLPSDYHLRVVLYRPIRLQEML